MPSSTWTAQWTAALRRTHPDPPRSGMVRLLAETGTQLTLIIIGDIDRSGGVGGWAQSERMLVPDADYFKSTPKDALSIPCALDLEEVGGPSLERRLDVLYGMGGPVDSDDGYQPPAIRLLGDVPTCRTQRWKLDDVKLGKLRFRRDAPDELRAIEVTLDLTTLNIGEPIGPVRIKRTRASTAGKRRQRTITARQGDTLRAIAVRQLGTSGQWTRLREWNPRLKRVDPDVPLKAGTHLVLH